MVGEGSELRERIGCGKLWTKNEGCGEWRGI